MVKLGRTLLVAAFVVALTGAALADANTEVQLHQAFTNVLQPVLMAVATAAAAVITAVASYAVSWLRAKTGLQGLELDAAHRASLESTLTNAAGLVLNKLGNNLDGKTIDVKDPIVKLAVDYVVRSAPQAVEHFGLQGDIDAIAQKVIAKIPQVANTNGVTNGGN